MSVREQHLWVVLNKTRFLSLPWVQMRNLASRVLSLVARRIGADFQARYGLPRCCWRALSRCRGCGTLAIRPPTGRVSGRPPDAASVIAATVLACRCIQETTELGYFTKGDMQGPGR
ncbi:Druantia anti-phage system protein DruA [Nitrococcus mobilis]|uniref:Druantia anti-phage system protein DruA n=1 Tax=Nitrococcus mobilis TaxID=35797 RepID=UPI0012EAB558